ncbi:cytochrome P450 [Rhodobacterales bacterium HKCCE3408]|nr:cytochrome P450 [Rhodobacterales bacterium HKCCE3408]
MSVVPPKPAARRGPVSLWRYGRMFRQDILSAQPDHLFSAKMAEFRTPFFRSYLLNEPELIDIVLRQRPQDFPKSDRVAAGLAPLLGPSSVFLTNGETWARQRRIIDPAFSGGRVRAVWPDLAAAAETMIARLRPGPQDIEPATSHAAADVIFRVLFSIPIEDAVAQAVYRDFRRYQRAQPLLNAAALGLPAGLKGVGLRARSAAAAIRRRIAALTHERLEAIAAGRAPDDLATRLLTATDPETGTRLSEAEMVDQVAIFFLAGHETSASALAWALYLLSLDPDAQDRVADEASENPTLSDISAATFTRDVFREALRLYPPVPMMVRTATRPERFRNRDIAPGSQIVISPWHLHRNPRLWDEADGFCPARHEGASGSAYLPFSAGPRICPGAGLAMIEGPLMLSRVVRAFRVAPVTDRRPVPVAHLTLRGKAGIWLNLQPR